jgi:hypothetical protein
LKQGGPSGPSSLSPEDAKAVKRLSVTLGALGVCLWIGTSTVLNGVIFGILMFVAIYVVVSRIPLFQTLVSKAGGFMDIAATGVTFVLLGGTLTAMVAAATVGCLFTVMLSMQKLKGTKSILDGLLSKAENYCKEVASRVEERAAAGDDDRAAGNGDPECPPEEGERDPEGGPDSR